MSSEKRRQRALELSEIFMDRWREMVDRTWDDPSMVGQRCEILNRAIRARAVANGKTIRCRRHGARSEWA